MTAHWANHCCALCFARTVARTPAVHSWPYMPICRASNEEARSKIRSSISAPVLDCGRHRESCRLFRERAREACRASTSVRELRRVDNAKPDRKSHKPCRPNRRCARAGRSVEELRNFEPWFLSATSDFFAAHSGEIAFPASFPVQFNAAPGRRLVVRGSTVSGRQPAPFEL